jgi:hypothetical protein
MISTIIDICKGFIDLVLKNKEIEKERKEKISETFQEISLILQDTADNLKEDVYPHGNCVVMEKLSMKLHSLLLGVIPDEDLNHLTQSLIDSSQIEREYGLRKEPETIPGIERASGEFKAMSILLKLS